MNIYLTRVTLTLVSLNDYHSNEEIATELRNLADGLIEMHKLIECNTNVHRAIERYLKVLDEG